MFDDSRAGTSAASRTTGTVWFEHPRSGQRVRIRKLGWRIAGFLASPFAMLFARLWGNAVACFAVGIGLGVTSTLYFPNFPGSVLGLIPATWGMFIPELMERKYVNAGWKRVSPGDAGARAKPTPFVLGGAAEGVSADVRSDHVPETVEDDPADEPVKRIRWGLLAGNVAAGVATLLVILGVQRWNEHRVASAVAEAAAPTSTSTRGPPGSLSECAQVTTFAAKQTNDPVFPRRIQGTLTNTCDYPARVVTIAFSLYDKSGAVVGDASSAVQSLGGGERWNFDLPITEDTASDFKLAKVEAYN